MEQPVFKPVFRCGDVLYLITDVEQLPCVVTGYELRPLEGVKYIVKTNSDESRHYAFELTTEPNFKLKKTYKED